MTHAKSVKHNDEELAKMRESQQVMSDNIDKFTAMMVLASHKNQSTLNLHKTNL